MQKPITVMNDTKHLTPKDRAIKYIIRCVIHDTILYQRKISPAASHLEILVFKAQEGQKLIGWSQLFKGSILNKQTRGQSLYYESNSGTRDSNSFSGKIWASKVIKDLIVISLELYITRYKIFHGTIPDEERRNQRKIAIKVATATFTEGFWFIQK